MVSGPRTALFVWMALAAVSPASAQEAAAPLDKAAALEFFEQKVRPVLVDNCYTCHSANTNAKGGLRVDDFKGLTDGGNSGAAVVPGKPEESLLIQAVSHKNDDLKMPPNKQLSPEEIADLTKWIQQGAVWPAAAPSVLADKPNAAYDKLKQEHWAWQPLGEAAPPDVRDLSWPRDDLDRFVLAKLEEQGLAPVADADKRTLIRRATFDLSGLPPTPREVDAFLADVSADAFARVVDRLLASPAFGERWGRHWLDVARYGESTGASRNLPFPHAWRYRDYVIDAFNNDKAYDQFLREQIAGDLLPAASEQEKRERWIATGFLALGVKDVNQRFKVRFVMDNIDEQIDTVSRSVLALTASCARCHDHKFDPIPTKDYYALAGIFHSTELCAGLRNKMGGGGLDYYDTQMLLVLDKEESDEAKAQKTAKIEEVKAALAKARSDLVALRDDPTKNVPGPEGEKRLMAARQEINRRQQELLSLTDPAANGGQVALGVREAHPVGDTEIRFRGEAEKLGPLVPRGFLSVLQFEGQPQVNPNQSGRLELAQWLSSDKNPLTPRVMANRVWQHLFGQGLVLSVDNFGVTGDKPSHPELLDHLARKFVADGWSVKRLVRKLVLSRAYQLSADASPAGIALDPANRLVWRHAPRRLDAEEIRDATLAIAGQLDLSRPAASPAKDFKVIELRNNGPEAKRLADHARASRNRSVYLPLLRGLTPASLEAFDFAEQGMVTGSRNTTTVATQALYLLNDPFVRRQAVALAERLLERTDLDDAGRVELAYRLSVARAPAPHETERASKYLAEYETAARDAIAAAAANKPETAVASAAPTTTTSVPAAATPAPKNPSPAGNAPAKVDAAPPQASSPLEQALAAARQAQAAAQEAQAAAQQALEAAQRAQAAAAQAQAAAQQALAAAAKQAGGQPQLGRPQPKVLQPKVLQPVVAANPNAAAPEGEPVEEPLPQLAHPRTAAWASFCQALLGAAEFRYLK